MSRIRTSTGPALIILALLAGALPAPAGGQTPVAPYRDPGIGLAGRVADLLGRMTLEEKFWQLYMSPGDLDNPTHDYSHGAFGLQIGMPSAPIAAGTNLARVHAKLDTGADTSSIHTESVELFERKQRIALLVQRDPVLCAEPFVIDVLDNAQPVGHDNNLW